MKYLQQYLHLLCRARPDKTAFASACDQRAARNG